MLDGLNEYIFVITGAAFISGIVTLLLPRGAFERPVSLVLGVFVLLCAVSPLKGGLESLKKLDFSVSGAGYDYAREDGWRCSADVMEQVLKDKIDGCVMKITALPAKEISVGIKSENSGFELEFAQIVLTAEQFERAQAIHDYVRMETGVAPKVISETGREYNGTG